MPRIVLAALLAVGIATAAAPPPHWAVADAILKKAEKARRKGLSAVQRKELDDVLAPLAGPKAATFAEREKAVADLEKAIAVNLRLFGENYQKHSTHLSKIGFQRYNQGDSARALAAFEAACALDRRRRATDDALAWNHRLRLASVYVSLDEPGKALAILVPLSDAVLATAGESSPYFHRCLLGRGQAHVAAGDGNAALALLRRCVTLARPRADKGVLPNALLAIGRVHLDAGRPAEAIAPLTEVRDLLKDAALPAGMNQRAYAVALLGEAKMGVGDLKAARAALEEGRAELRKRNGAGGHAVIRAGAALALTLSRSGERDAGHKLSNEVLEDAHRQFRLSAAYQSETQQIASRKAWMRALDMRLSHIGVKSGQAYQAVLNARGAVFVQQRLRHETARLAEAAGPEARRLVAELREVGREAAADAGEDGPADPVRLAALLVRKEKLEAALGAASAAFRRENARNRIGIPVFRRALPHGVAVLDFHEYTHHTPARKKAEGGLVRSVAAFVVRNEDGTRPVNTIPLGPSVFIREAADKWLRAITKRDTRAEHEAGAAVRRLLWAPVAGHLAGAKTVLISTDGFLARLPFAALPGAKPDTYLIEDHAVASLPVPQALPDMLARPVPKGPPSILLVGDVDFGRSEDEAWIDLPATRVEVAAIKDTFTRAFPGSPFTDLRKDGATLKAVRGGVGGHRFAHFATHGFYREEDEQHAGLRAGIVLAGANRRRDAILTALEVADMDLSGMDLAVLSACQTGLGKAVGGEGMLGLQRAFAVAGCRGVVSSLWSVDDDATRALMVAFYDNLWARKTPLSRVEALRQAQMLMLREGFKRGMVREERMEKTRRVPPFFWAAFTLAGDWR